MFEVDIAISEINHKHINAIGKIAYDLNVNPMPPSTIKHGYAVEKKLRKRLTLIHLDIRY